MEPRIDPPSLLLHRAGVQAGVLSSEQTTAYGLGRHSVARLIGSGSWQRLATGLYFTDRTRPPWLAWAWGGILLAGPDARLGGAAAGHLHGLLDQPPRTLLIWTVGADQRRSREPWRFRRTSNQLRWPGGQLPPVISIEDTVLDLCAGRQVREVVELVTRAVQHRLTRPEYLLRRMHERGRVGHRRLISDLLAEVEDGAETPLELAYLIEVERAHGLPTGRRQRRERVSGHHRDVWYEQWRTVVELDGRLGHEGVGRFRDMALDNVAALRAETTLRYGWHDVRGRPCDVAREVGQVLRRAGWPGSLAECRRCRGRVCPSV